MANITRKHKVYIPVIQIFHGYVFRVIWFSMQTTQHKQYSVYPVLFNGLMHALKSLIMLTLFSSSTVLAGEQKTLATASTNSELDTIIQDKINYYNNRYPDIRFVHLEGGKDWTGELIAMITMLGSQVSAMDYKHPPELREDVMEVSLERLRRMLKNDIVSATLFRVGQDSLFERPQLCVITLNPEAFVASDREATQYMLDVSDKVLEKIHPSRYLNHRDHLEVTLDHEAYHCLDSHHHGGSPMTDETLGGEYHLFRRESVADAYAIAMHIRSRRKVTAYARNLVHYRALWMFTDSPNRCTFETAREVLKLQPGELANMSDKEVRELAVELRDGAVRPYDGYVRQRSAALTAAKVLGLDPVLYGDQWCDCERMETDPELVAALVNRYRYYYDQLFTGGVVPLEAPPLTGALQR